MTTSLEEYLRPVILPTRNFCILASVKEDAGLAASQTR